MGHRFFPTGAKTADDHEAANLMAGILVGMHQKGEIQKAFKDIFDRGWQNYLPMARTILEFGRTKSQASAYHVQSIIQNELRSNNFESTEADQALRELNKMAHMDANAAVPEAFIKYSNKIGHHFQDGWESLGKAYIQFQASANSYGEIIQLVDQETRKQQPRIISP